MARIDLFDKYQDELGILLLCGDIHARMDIANDVKENFNVFRIASWLTCDNITNGPGKQFQYFDMTMVYVYWMADFVKNLITSPQSEQEAKQL